jgi:cytochrome c peroxidase
VEEQLTALLREGTGTPQAERTRPARTSVESARARAIRRVKLTLVLATVAIMLFTLTGRSDAHRGGEEPNLPESGKAFSKDGRQMDAAARALVEEGKQIFRFDTFGDEAFWGDKLKLHQAIQGSKFGGLGPGVSPKTALAVGLKVDMEALPASLVQQIKDGQVDLDDPATTLALIKLNAVLGVKGQFNDDGSMKSIGISCALCHSTVDDAFAPGIGRRLDGWANRDLNVGAIISLSPDLSEVERLLGIDRATLNTVLQSWGPGKFDAQVFLDGKAFRPDGKPAATLIPPAFGLAGINLHTWNGWGSLTQWNAFVANLEMRGIGNFDDERLNDPVKYPIAARNGFAHIRNEVDLITPKLPALQAYQLSLDAPVPPIGSFNEESARKGKELFNNKAQCSTCHTPPLFTESGWNMHTAEEIGIDDFQAMRSPDERYRTAPLNGLWTHQKGGFYHDGRFATMLDVVNHYNSFRQLNLTEQEKGHVVEYLKSLPEAASFIDIRDSTDFVTQHYRDFLGREPDPEGLAFWTSQIESCGSNAQCREVRRINVSAAFFLSIEFQETGNLVYKTYKAAFGNMPGAPVPLTLGEFLPDKQEIGRGVIIGQPGADALLEQNKVAYFNNFVQRARFTSVYPTTLTPEQYVDALNANTGGSLTADERQAAINEFGGAATIDDVSARARALRRVAENKEFADREKSRAFVLMQYFGYLRRNPNDPPDKNFDGYIFWLTNLEKFNGDFVAAEMVKAFITSIEYLRRFGA